MHGDFQIQVVIEKLDLSRSDHGRNRKAAFLGERDRKGNEGIPNFDHIRDRPGRRPDNGELQLVQPAVRHRQA